MKNAECYISPHPTPLPSGEREGRGEREEGRERGEGRKRGEGREKGVGCMDQEIGDFVIEKKIPLNPPFPKGDKRGDGVFLIPLYRRGTYVNFAVRRRIRPGAATWYLRWAPT